jgi:hypothetical protein
MSVGKGLLSGGLMLLMGVAVLAAPGDNNTGQSAPRRSRAGLTRPWNQLKDLTGDEKSKIIDIHRKAADEIREIRAKEHADILVLLSEDQKKEIVQIEARDRGRRGATTRPSAAPGDSNEK